MYAPPLYSPPPYGSSGRPLMSEDLAKSSTANVAWLLAAAAIIAALASAMTGMFLARKREQYVNMV